VKVIGVEPDQLPFVAVRVLPTMDVPRMRGSPVGVGAVAAEATLPDGSSTAKTKPTEIAATIAARLRRRGVVFDRIVDPLISYYSS
jgi:hypothetical protein